LRQNFLLPWSFGDSMARIRGSSSIEGRLTIRPSRYRCAARLKSGVETVANAHWPKTAPTAFVLLANGFTAAALIARSMAMLSLNSVVPSGTACHARRREYLLKPDKTKVRQVSFLGGKRDSGASPLDLMKAKIDSDQGRQMITPLRNR
jgi:hypothetical protein